MKLAGGGGIREQRELPKENKMAASSFDDVALKTFFPEKDGSQDSPFQTPPIPENTIVYAPRYTALNGHKVMTVDDAKIRFNGYFAMDVPFLEEQKKLADLDVVYPLYTHIPVLLCQYSLTFVNNEKSSLLRDAVAMLTCENDLKIFFTENNVLYTYLKSYFFEDKYKTQNGNMKYCLGLTLKNPSIEYPDMPKDCFNTWKMRYYEDIAENNRRIERNDADMVDPHLLVERHKTAFFEERCGVICIWPNPIALVDNMILLDKFFIVMKLTQTSVHEDRTTTTREYHVPLKLKEINSNRFVESRGSVVTETRVAPDTFYFAPVDKFATEISFNVNGLSDVVKMSFYVSFNGEIRYLEDAFEHTISSLISGIGTVNTIRRKFLDYISSADWENITTFQSLQEQISKAKLEVFYKTIGNFSAKEPAQTQNFHYLRIPILLPVSWNRITYYKSSTIESIFASALTSLNMEGIHKLREDELAYTRRGGFDDKNYFAVMDGRVFFDAFTEIRTLMMKIYNEKVIIRIREAYRRAEAAAEYLKTQTNSDDLSAVVPATMYIEIMKTTTKDVAKLETALIDLAIFHEMVVSGSAMYYSDSFIVSFFSNVSWSFLQTCKTRTSYYYNAYRARRQYFRKKTIFENTLTDVKKILQQKILAGTFYGFDIVFNDIHGYFMPSFFEKLFTPKAVGAFEDSADKLTIARIMKIFEHNKTNACKIVDFGLSASSSSSSSSSSTSQEKKVLMYPISDDMLRTCYY